MALRIIAGIIGLSLLAEPTSAAADPGPPHPMSPPPGAHTLGEKKFLDDIAAQGMRLAPGIAGETNALSEGYVICGDLRGGYSRAWVAENASTLPGLANLGAGTLSPHERQLLVNTAWVDLCPEVPDRG